MDSGHDRVRAEVGTVLAALVEAGVWTHETAAGEVWVDAAASLRALQMDMDDEDCLERASAIPVRCIAVGEGMVEACRLEHVLELAVFSNHPAGVRYLVWLCSDFLPAIRRYGYYDPAHGHEPPPGQELDALERREGMRDALNGLMPGLGDLLS